VIKGQPYKQTVKQDTPVLFFEEEGRKFTVEFKNQTDYFSSSYGHVATVMVISHNRSVRFPGEMSNVKI